MLRTRCCVYKRTDETLLTKLIRTLRKFAWIYPESKMIAVGHWVMFLPTSTEHTWYLKNEFMKNILRKKSKDKKCIYIVIWIYFYLVLQCNKSTDKLLQTAYDNEKFNQEKMDFLVVAFFRMHCGFLCMIRA